MSRPEGSRGNGISPRWWIAGAGVVLAAVAVIAFVSYGHLRPGGTPKQQLKVWVSSTQLGQEVGTLYDDGLDIDKVLSRHKGTVAVHTDCSVLSVTAESGNSNLPSPDTQITQMLARAYQLEYDAGNNCYAAGATNTKLLARSAAQRAEAEKIFDEVLARVGVLTGESVSTTTTTEPTTGGIFG
jgi:hypothetical protein